LSPEARRTIGVRIETVRRRLDRTPREFARMLGVPQQAVRIWERGLGFRQDDLLLLAEATDTSIDWLVEGITDRDIEEGEEAATANAPFDASRLFPKSDERVQVRRVMTDEELSKSIASAQKISPDSLTVARNTGAGPDGVMTRPSALFLDLPGATLVSGARSATYRLNRSDLSQAGGRLFLSLALSGRRRIEQLGREHDVAEGRAVLVSDIDDGSVSYDTSGRYVSVYLPTMALLQRAPEAEAHFLRPFAPDSQPVHLLAAYVSSLTSSADGLTRSQAATAAEHVLDLCALMAGASGDSRALAEGRGLREAQRRQIAHTIEVGAVAPGFSPRSISRQLGLTEREIHDLLWEAGQSYSELVGDRRAAIARRRLADPRDAHLAIEEIAFLSGFMDFDRFKRAFTAQFGMTPADVRSGIGREPAVAAE
jgi:AraC-like DNA-binding protein/transcriptional regulator with XRE-family HTH domain